MKGRVVLAVLGLCVSVMGCNTGDSHRKEEMSQGQRRAKLTKILDGQVRLILQKMGKKKRIVISQIYENRGNKTTIYSPYLLPLLEEIFSKRGAIPLVRKGLDRLLQELDREQSDWFDQNTCNRIGKLVAGKYLILSSGISVSWEAFQIELRAVDIESGRLITSTSFSLSKRLLPIRYGGK